MPDTLARSVAREAPTDDLGTVVAIYGVVLARLLGYIASRGAAETTALLELLDMAEREAGAGSFAAAVAFTRLRQAVEARAVEPSAA
jgi:hypothetical protein